MKRFKFLVLISILFYSLSGIAQGTSVTFSFIDAGSREPVDSVYWSLLDEKPIFEGGILDSRIDTLDIGVFRVDSLDQGDYLIDAYTFDHYQIYYEFSVNEDSPDNIEIEIELYSIDEDDPEKYTIKNVAKFDNIHLFLGYGRNPLNDDNFSSQWSIYEGLSYKYYISPRLQWGWEQSLVFRWARLQNDTQATPEVYTMERYFGINYPLYIYMRGILSKNKVGLVGTFIDAGIGYEFPLFNRYVFEDENGDKQRQKKIVKYNYFFANARLGYRRFALSGTYRFTDVMRGDYPEPPRYNVSLEIQLSGF